MSLNLKLSNFAKGHTCKGCQTGVLRLVKFKYWFLFSFYFASKPPGLACSPAVFLFIPLTHNQERLKLQIT